MGRNVNYPYTYICTQSVIFLHPFSKYFSFRNSFQVIWGTENLPHSAGAADAAHSAVRKNYREVVSVLCAKNFSDVYAANQLPHRARAVYMYLRDRSGPGRDCWPSIGTIAGDLGLSRSTVKRGLEELVRAGFVRREARWRENGSRSSDRYVVLR